MFVCVLVRLSQFGLIDEDQVVSGEGRHGWGGRKRTVGDAADGKEEDAHLEGEKDELRFVCTAKRNREIVCVCVEESGEIEHTRILAPVPRRVHIRVCIHITPPPQS